MKCANCGLLIDASARFCSQCGTALLANEQDSGSATPELGYRNTVGNLALQFSESRTEARLERRQLTIMFCDLKNSTKLAEQMEPDDLGDLIGTYRTLCLAPIERYQGRITRYLGDGILVLFGFPRAGEYDPEQAVRAGLEIVDEMKSLENRWRSIRHEKLAVKIAIHTGIVLVGRLSNPNVSEEIEVIGEAPNLASHLQDKAKPNSVILTEQTQKLLRGSVRCSPLRKVSVKGLSDQIAVCEALGVDSGYNVERGIAGTISDLPLVGRDRELSKLQDYWSIVKRGEGKSVILSGDPGIGKSRIVKAIQQLVDPKTSQLLSTRASRFAMNSDFFAFAELFRTMLRQAHTSRPGKVSFRILQQYLNEQGLPDKEAALGFASLIDLEIPDVEVPRNFQPEHKRDLIFGTMIRWLAERSKVTPVLLVVEDLHWADASTLELINLVLSKLQTCRVLVILSVRDKANVPGLPDTLTEIRLGPLNADNSRILLKHILGGEQFSRQIIRTLLAKAGGNPLYIEELSKAIIETEGQFDLSTIEGSSGVGWTESVPAALRDSLMARLDQIGEGKAVAQIGAVLGHTFEFTMLRQAWRRSESSLIDGVSKLVDASIVIQHGELPQAKFEFKHAMIESIAYDSLLRQDRRRYHLRAAHALSGDFRDFAKGRSEILARHYEEAGMTDRAIALWEEAGLTAAKRSANVEAMHHYQKALHLIDDSGDSQDAVLRILIELIGVTSAALGWTSNTRLAYLERALKLCEHPDRIVDRVTALSGITAYHYVAGDFDQAYEDGCKCLEAAHASEDRVALIEAYRLVGEIQAYRAEFEHSKRLLDQSIALYDVNEHREIAVKQGLGDDPAVVAYLYLSMVLWFLGRGEEALAANMSGHKLAKQVNHLHTEVQAQFYTAQLHWLRRDFSSARRYLQGAEALFRRRSDFRLWQGQTMVLDGWTTAVGEGRSEGIARLKKGLEILEEEKSGSSIATYEPLLAEAELYAGDLESALYNIDLALSRERRDRWMESERHRIKGQILSRQGRGAGEVTRSIETAIKVARDLKMPLLELRSTTDLCRYLHEQGDPRVGQTDLSSALVSISQDLWAPDIVAARELLVRMQA